MSQAHLPPDVLGEIFVLCLPKRDSDRLRPHNAPLLLCQVSSGWRAAAVAKHRLWDTVLFPPSKHALCSKFIDDGGVERWFDRTGRVLPLSFGEEPSDGPTDSLITQFQHIITRYASRFTHLSLVMTKEEHLESFRRDFPRDAFDQLQTLSLCTSLRMKNDHPIAAFPRIVTPFKTAPRLKQVSFSIIFKADPTKFELPWSQITSIDVVSRRRPLDLEEWQALFKTCRNLQQGSFVFPWCCSASETPSFTHPSLKCLTLVLPNEWDEALFDLPFRFHVAKYDLEHLFSAVTFPSLQHLRLEFGDGRKPLLHTWEVCQTLRSSLETVVFGWQRGSDKYAPGEAFQFIDGLSRKPGVFTSLKHIVLPCESSKLDHIEAVLRLHPRLDVTIPVVPRRREEWRHAIDTHEQSSNIKNRISILSTDHYDRLDVDDTTVRRVAERGSRSHIP